MIKIHLKRVVEMIKLRVRWVLRGKIVLNRDLREMLGCLNNNLLIYHLKYYKKCI